MNYQSDIELVPNRARWELAPKHLETPNEEADRYSLEDPDPRQYDWPIPVFGNGTHGAIRGVSMTSSIENFVDSNSPIQCLPLSEWAATFDGQIGKMNWDATTASNIGKI